MRTRLKMLSWRQRQLRCRGLSVTDDNIDNNVDDIILSLSGDFIRPSKCHSSLSGTQHFTAVN